MGWHYANEGSRYVGQQWRRWRDPLRLARLICALFFGPGLWESGGVWLLAVALLELATLEYWLFALKLGPG